MRRKTRELPGSGVVKAPMPVVLSEVDFLDTVIVAAAAAGLTRVMLPCGISPKSRRFRAVLLNAADRQHQTPQRYLAGHGRVGMSISALSSTADIHPGDNFGLLVQTHATYEHDAKSTSLQTSNVYLGAACAFRIFAKNAMARGIASAIAATFAGTSLRPLPGSSKSCVAPG